MPSTYTSDLRLELQADGENSTTWGQKVNTALQLIEDAIAGALEVATGGGDTTLTTVNGGTDQSRYAILKITGMLVSNANIIVPDVSKTYVVQNATSGAYTVTVKTSGGSGVVVTQGAVVHVFCDGTDVILAAGGSAQAEMLTNKTVNLSNNTVTGTKAQFDTACSDGNFIYESGALGTPASGTLTNCTGLPAAGVVGTAATLAGTETLTNKTMVVVAGAVTTPSITTVDDLNTGVWFPAADTLAVSVGGFEGFRLNSSLFGIFNSRVGSGGVTPSAGFHAAGTGLNGGLRLENTTAARAVDIFVENDGTFYVYDRTDAKTRISMGPGKSLALQNATSSSGTGISFPATQNPSSDANTLDDYEEGTWTPSLTCAVVGDLSVTYTTREGTYTKIGNTVTARFLIGATVSYTTSYGDVKITGIPFTAALVTPGPVSLTSVLPINTRAVLMALNGVTYWNVYIGSAPVQIQNQDASANVGYYGQVTYTV